MNSFNFGRVIPTYTKPTTAQREAFVKNGLRDHLYGTSYMTVHEVTVPTASTFYAVVSFKKANVIYQTYVCGNIRARKKGDDYWMDADCFVAAQSTPPDLSCAPAHILEAGENLQLQPMVDQGWLDLCNQNIKEAEHRDRIRKGNVFRADNGPVPVLGGREACYAVIINKTTALFIAPISRQCEARSIDSLGINYNLIPANVIPSMTDAGSNREVGELVFEIVGDKANLKGRMLKGAKAKRQLKAKSDRYKSIMDSLSKLGMPACWDGAAWFS
ncbi:hypothetical protein [Pseudomonas sp. P9(2020)]|uniref:hypothetical protein n=1 Tax=Pseudomonas sp. P9(2020) TaxID=2763316 RepID=UPI001B32EFC6|nr:hypothetical protein [Pseudomonas sp. P9(2020)]MBP5947864.1 hypothetical protein [Pseudomonas sp. P9(2020)]